MTNDRAGAWLAGARFDHGLYIAGLPSRRAADLRLTPEYIEAGKGGVRVRFDWQDFRPLDAPTRGKSDYWSFSGWGGYGGDGIALLVVGRSAPDTARVQEETRSILNRVARFGKGTRAPIVPLWAVSTLHGLASVQDMRFIDMLCHLAETRDDARVHLGERARVEAFIAEVRRNRPKHHGEKLTMRPRTTEIMHAMEAMGFTHPFHGRPLPDQTPPDEDTAVRAIIDHIAADSGAGDVHIDDVTVREFYRRSYSQVAPWPVGALLSDSG